MAQVSLFQLFGFCEFVYCLYLRIVAEVLAIVFKQRCLKQFCYIHVQLPKQKCPDLQRCDQFQVLLKSMGTDECSVLLKTRPFIYRCLNMAPNFEKPGFKIIYHLPSFDIWVPAARKGKKGNEETIVMKRSRAPLNISLQSVPCDYKNNFKNQ